MLEQSNFGNKIAVAFIERKKRSLISLGLGFVQRGLPTYCRLKKKKRKMYRTEPIYRLPQGTRNDFRLRRRKKMIFY